MPLTGSVTAVVDKPLVFGRWLGIGTLTVALLLPGDLAWGQERSLRVLLDVEWNDTSTARERRLGDQLESYLRREFRALGDVEVLPWDEGWGAKKLYPDDVGVGVLGFHDRSHGIAVSVEAWTACPEVPALPYDSAGYGELVDRWVEEGNEDGLQALSALLDNCRVQNARWLHILPSSALSSVVRGIVASIDTDVLEPLRRGRRPEKLRIP